MDSGQPSTELVPSGEQMTQVEVRTLIGRTWELTLERLDAQQLPEGRQILRLLVPWQTRQSLTSYSLAQKP